MAAPTLRFISMGYTKGSADYKLRALTAAVFIDLLAVSLVVPLLPGMVGGGVCVREVG